MLKNWAWTWAWRPPPPPPISFISEMGEGGGGLFGFWCGGTRQHISPTKSHPGSVYIRMNVWIGHIGSTFYKKAIPGKILLTVSEKNKGINITVRRYVDVYVNG